MLTKLQISQDQEWGIWDYVQYAARDRAQAQLGEDICMDVFWDLQNPIAFFGLWEEISHVVYGQIREGREDL